VRGTGSQVHDIRRAHEIHFVTHRKHHLPSAFADVQTAEQHNIVLFYVAEMLLAGLARWWLQSARVHWRPRRTDNTNLSREDLFDEGGDTDEKIAMRKQRSVLLVREPDLPCTPLFAT
jgi:hypothetical protein